MLNTEILSWDFSKNVFTSFLETDSNVKWAAFSPSGTQLITIHEGNWIRLWEKTEDGSFIYKNEFLPVLAMENNIKWAAFGRNSKRFITIHENNSIWIWEEAEEGSFTPIVETNISQVHPDITNAVSSPYSNTVLITENSFIEPLSSKRTNIQNIMNNTAIFKYHDLQEIRFLPDKNTFLTTSRSSLNSNLTSVRLWELNDEFVTYFISNKEEMILSPIDNFWVDVDDEAQAFFTVHEDAVVQWNKLGQEMNRFQFPSEIIAISGDKQIIATIDNDKQIVQLWSPQGDLLGKLIGHTSRINNVVFSPDSQLIVTVSGNYDGEVDNTARLWDLSGKQIAEINGHGSGVVTAAFSPDGQQIATGGAYDGSIRLWNLIGGNLRTIEDDAFSLSGIAKFYLDYTPDGKAILAVANYSRTKLWNTVGEQLLSLKGINVISSPNYAPIIAPDGQKIILINNPADSVVIYNLQGDILSILSGHEAAISSIQISPDGAMILTTSDDDTTRLWGINGESLATFFNSGRFANFSQDGKFIITQGNDADHLTLWTIPSNTEIINAAQLQLNRGFTETECAQFFRNTRDICPQTVKAVFTFFAGDLASP